MAFNWSESAEGPSVQATKEIINEKEVAGEKYDCSLTVLKV